MTMEAEEVPRVEMGKEVMAVMGAILGAKPALEIHPQVVLRADQRVLDMKDGASIPLATKSCYHFRFSIGFGIALENLLYGLSR